MKLNLVFFLVVMSFFASAETPQLNHISLRGHDHQMVDGFKKQYQMGPNFNHDNYLFTYVCFGRFICGSIYVPEQDKFVGFPDMYFAGDREDVAQFKATFGLNSDTVCVSGTSGPRPDKTYDNVCYALHGQELRAVDDDS